MQIKVISVFRKGRAQSKRRISDSGYFPRWSELWPSYFWLPAKTTTELQQDLMEVSWETGAISL